MSVTWKFGIAATNPHARIGTIQPGGFVGGTDAEQEFDSFDDAIEAANNRRNETGRGYSAFPIRICGCGCRFWHHVTADILRCCDCGSEYHMELRSVTVTPGAHE